MNDQKTYKGFNNNKNKLHSLQVVNLKIYLWISILLINVAAVFAQESSGLFGAAAGSTFLTLGVFILIIFFIGDQIFRQMRGKK